MSHCRIFVILLVFLSMSVDAFSAERPDRVATGKSAPRLSAPLVLSIVPAQAEPRGKITIFGAGFGNTVKVYLGSVEVLDTIVEDERIEFTVPERLQAGLYALYISRGDGAVSRPYNITVLPLRPVLIGFSPERIDSCAQGGDREVTVLGQNFNENSALLFDGAVVKSRLISPEAISFIVPQAPGGLRHIMIKNSPDNASFPMAFSVETRPEINMMRVGAEYVNFYELIVEGRNFYQGAALYVDGRPVGDERERLIYVDCHQLVYQRYPYSQTDKTLRVQVVNPNGEASQVMTINTP